MDYSTLGAESRLLTELRPAAPDVVEPLAQRPLLPPEALPLRQRLQQRYTLSPRECDVCSAFINSGNLLRTAADCGLSTASTRSYLRDIYAKTGHHSQVELMRLLIGMADANRSRLPGHRLPARSLHDRYRLSPREVDICQRFLDTPELGALAVAAGLALSSLRTCLKSIYDKTGQHSQAELMRFLMELTRDFSH